jgi:hypothetical protein
MEVHKITLYVVDFDQLGADGVATEITNVRFPNDCISPEILKVESADAGEWHDGHPLNNSDTCAAEIARLFQEPAA